jgi:hypothetical protein
VTDWPATTLLIGLDASGTYQAINGITAAEAGRLYNIAWLRQGKDINADGARQSRGFFHSKDRRYLPGHFGEYEAALADLATIRS